MNILLSSFLRPIFFIVILFFVGANPPAQEIVSPEPVIAEVAAEHQEAPEWPKSLSRSWDNNTRAQNVSLSAVESMDGVSGHVAKLERPTKDPLNLIDVERTYWEVADILGREPEIEELMYMTVSSEYWGLVHNSSKSLIGQEAIARAYYHFCGKEGECTKEELFKFLSGYQVWFAKNGRTDTDEKVRELAERLYNIKVSRYHYEYANGPKLEAQIQEILDENISIQKGWRTGLSNNRPWQWYGPFPTGGNVDARSCTKVAEGQRFCFFTYAQTLKFKP